MQSKVIHTALYCYQIALYPVPILMIFWESSLYNVEIFGSPVFAVRQWRNDESCPQ